MQICLETKDGHTPTVCTDTQVCVSVLKMEASSSAQEKRFSYIEKKAEYPTSNTISSIS